MDKATKVISVRLTEEQYAYLKKIAIQEKRDVATMIRLSLAGQYYFNDWPRANIERGNPDLKK